MTNKSHIKRPIYLDRILPFLGKDLIKVITGQRRVGKSVILHQIADEYKEKRPDDLCLFIDKELPEFNDIMNAEDLIAYVHAENPDSRKVGLFIDEIQEIQRFEIALRGLKAEGLCDIYCSGSNADLLSGELATHLTGRYITLCVHALSFMEFLQFHKLENTDDSLMHYLRYGGLPYLIHLPGDETVVKEYLLTIKETVLFKDIVARYGVRNIPFLERLTEFVADTIGSPLSANSISRFLKSQRINIPTNQVVSYLDHCTKAYLISRLKRHDIMGKKIFEIGEKFYFEDLGIRNSIIGYRHSDIGKLLENTVLNHLRICGFEVKVGVLGELEIDFVATKNSETLYVQVAYLIPDEQTAKREFGNLQKIKDNYPKIVVSMDPVPFTDNNGIGHYSIREFLMKSW